ncbi:nuclear receptor subfamily 1 group I member 3 [Ammospiza nelsoni]|uniref:nuclear receptor subfamily 1 group I member 3 n=1 Tax=Ammospiza caudacuta TaxID=2857398 RepID=UPI00273A3749|nr:nuclear receptor subfamily 1 group I member 3 [Ammospiza caudacuta]XP_059346115.1 nuclear receptor subfamily 1 group I member 3 [Ammospiza nelsoni]
MEGTLGDRQGHAGTAGDTEGHDVPSLHGDNSLSPTAPGDTDSGVSLSSPPGAAQDPAGDTEPEGDKVCAVCGDRASGYHFHVMSCEGCKGFFRRSILKGVRFSCPLARRCPVTKAKRRQCQACRLQKCLDVGMRRDMIMSEEALRRRRELRGQRGQAGGQRRHEGQRGHAGLTAEQQELIALLIGAHQRTFDSSFSQFMHCWPAVRLLVPSPPGGAVAAGVSLSLSLSPREEALPDVLSLLPQFADLSTFMIQQVIKFAKEIPAFRSLPLEAQISLLKGATLGICQIRFNTVFNPRTKAWECGQRCYTIRDGALAGFQQVYLEPLLKFHESLRRLRLHEAEYALLQAMLLFSPDHAGIAQREAIDQFQEKVALTLKSYIDHQHPPEEGRFLYAKLLLLLTELQTLKVENTRQILHIQDLSAMTPLLSEIIS